VKIDDDRLRERDREAFRRNNPRAYEMIQKQRDRSDKMMLEGEERKKKLRLMHDGQF